MWNNKGILVTGSVKKILGEHAEQFFEGATKDPEHIQIGLQAFWAKD